MSKYIEYGHKLAEAFKKARKEQADVANQLSDAEKAFDLAGKMTSEKYYGQRDFLIRETSAKLNEARETYRRATNDIWYSFKNIVRGLTEEYKEALRSDSLVNPSEIDPNTIALLESGICSPDDIRGLVSQFKGNKTMLKLISNHTGNYAEKTGLSEYRIIQQGIDREEYNQLAMWETICETVDTLTGQRHGVADPGYTQSMNNEFEKLVEPMINAL